MFRIILQLLVAFLYILSCAHPRFSRSSIALRRTRCVTKLFKRIGLLQASCRVQARVTVRVSGCACIRVGRHTSMHLGITRPPYLRESAIYLNAGENVQRARCRRMNHPVVLVFSLCGHHLPVIAVNRLPSISQAIEPVIQQCAELNIRESRYGENI